MTGKDLFGVFVRAYGLYLAVSGITGFAAVAAMRGQMERALGSHSVDALEASSAAPILMIMIGAGLFFFADAGLQAVAGVMDLISSRAVTAGEASAEAARPMAPFPEQIGRAHV